MTVVIATTDDLEPPACSADEQCVATEERARFGPKVELIPKPELTGRLPTYVEEAREAANALYGVDVFR